MFICEEENFWSRDIQNILLKSLSCLLVEEDEVHLDKDKGHLQNWSEYREQILAVCFFIEIELKEHADLDA